MNSELAFGLLRSAARHLLTTAGGGLAVHGITTDASTVEALVGALMTLVGFAWSLWAKRQNIVATAA